MSPSGANVAEWPQCAPAGFCLSPTALDNNNTNSFQLVNLIGDRNHRILKKDKTKKKQKLIIINEIETITKISGGRERILREC